LSQLGFGSEWQWPTDRPGTSALEAAAANPQWVLITWLICSITGLPRMSNVAPEAMSWMATRAAMIGAALSEDETIDEISSPVAIAATPVRAMSSDSSATGEKWRTLAALGPP